MKGSSPALQPVNLQLKGSSPAVVVLGGSANALSVARSLGRRGIEVYVSANKGNHVQYSRFIKQALPVPPGVDKQTFWADLLLAKQKDRLQGSVVFPCNDEGVQFVATHRKALQNHYILDDSIPELQLAMLDKQRTLEMAQSVGLHTPQFWRIHSLDDLQAIQEQINFPVIVKPIHSHLFQRHFQAKLFYAFDLKELQKQLDQVLALNLEIMLTEWIPGPDRLLGSYYTYINQAGEPIFHYTKKIIRRFPVNQGLACYHITEWDQEIADLGLQFFRGINFRGFGNIEFKRDLRDGRMKVIECNPRFTAAQELIARSGMDMAVLVYNHLVGQPLPQVNSYKQGLRYWYPLRDFRAFLQLRQRKELTFWRWMRSILHRQVFPYFQWKDPLPALVPFWRELQQKVMK